MAVLIVFAHPLEADPLLQLVNARPLVGNLYAFAGGHIVISGMGSVAAAVATALHHNAHEEVWNAGLAGALRPQLNPGEIIEVGLASRYLAIPEGVATSSRELARNAHLPVAVGVHPHRLVSCDHGVQTSSLRELLAAEHDLVDMEGYGVARAAQAAKKPCRLWKIVSDYAGPNISAEIRKRLPLLAKQLAHHLNNELSV